MEVPRRILDSLDQLGTADFKVFKWYIAQPVLDGCRPIPKSYLEDEDRPDVVSRMTDSYGEEAAVNLTVAILKRMNLNNEAEKLQKARPEKELGGQSSNPGSSGTVGPSAGAEGGCTGADFVDKHRVALIDRVNGIPSILDELLDKKVITQEVYDEISALPTNSEKMRKLYSGPLRSAGPEGKEVFFKFLERTEKSLVDDLKRKK